jgi:hypothetical protein
VKLSPEEPAAGPWRVEPVAAVAATLAGRSPAPDGRPVIVAAGGMSPADFDSWIAEELPFLAADRPWERAALLVVGTPRLVHDPRTELVVATRR